MKLKQYIKIACLSSFTVVATSCLDLEPKANLSDSTVWNKASNFQLFADQFYGWTSDFVTAIGDNVHSDYRSDLVCGSSVNTYSQGTNTIPSSDGNYGTNYKRIYYTNLLLKNAESFSDPASIAIPVAEAKFFRAYAYFELVQIYGDALSLLNHWTLILNNFMVRKMIVVKWWTLSLKICRKLPEPFRRHRRKLDV